MRVFLIILLGVFVSLDFPVFAQMTTSQTGISSTSTSKTSGNRFTGRRAENKSSNKISHNGVNLRYVEKTKGKFKVYLRAKTLNPKMRYKLRKEIQTLLEANASDETEEKDRVAGDNLESMIKEEVDLVIAESKNEKKSSPEETSKEPKESTGRTGSTVLNIPDPKLMDQIDNSALYTVNTQKGGQFTLYFVNSRNAKKCMSILGRQKKNYDRAVERDSSLSETVEVSGGDYTFVHGNYKGKTVFNVKSCKFAKNKMNADKDKGVVVYTCPKTTSVMGNPDNAKNGLRRMSYRAFFKGAELQGKSGFCFYEHNVYKGPSISTRMKGYLPLHYVHNIDISLCKVDGPNIICKKGIASSGSKSSNGVSTATTFNRR